MTVLDCDEWRRNYGKWTVAEHKAFYKDVWDAYPNQSHHAPEIAQVVFEMHAPREVVEIGGWDGELAVSILDRFPNVERWTNVEICEQAVDRGHSHPRYWPLSPGTWYWDHKWHGDMLVASHCIEHMSAEHLEATIAASDMKYLYFDAPLVDTPTSWWGSSTTHILEVGWDGVTAICNRYGYLLTWAAPHTTPPESGGYARAMVYTRQGPQDE